MIGERGLKALSFRAVAKELGGSTTMVTHFYSTQAELIAGLADSFVINWDAEVTELEQNVEDPYERLLLLLEWLAPTDPEGVLEERTRIALLAEGLVGDSRSANFDVWEKRARKLLRSHLEQIVPKQEVALRVDVLRALTNGIQLSIVEHPEHWNKRRVVRVLRQSLQDMGLAKAE